MGFLSKSLASVLILTVALSSACLLMVKPANAQTTPSPSMPQFRLSLQGWTNNYYVQIDINNQPFTTNGSNQLYYFIQLKDHNSSDNNWLISPQIEQQIYLTDITHLLIPSFKMPHTPFIVPTGTLVDFQVEAVISNINGSESSQSSGWSPTQTIYVPANVPTATPSTSTPIPTPTTIVPEFPSWIIPLIFAVMITVTGLVVYFKKQQLTSVNKP